LRTGAADEDTDVAWEEGRKYDVGVVGTGGGREGEDRREGHPPFWRRDWEREEENQRGNERKRRESMWRREGRRKRQEKGFWLNQSEVRREERFDEEAWNKKMKRRREEWVKRHEKIFGESQWETRRGGPWRERKRWRGAGCGGGAHSLFLPGWRDGRNTPAVPTGIGAPAVLDGMEGGTTGGGGRGGEGEEGDTRCSCRDRVTSRGRGKGERRRSGEGVWTRVEGHSVRHFGDRRVGGGCAVGDKVRVGEGGVPTGGEGRAVVQIAGVGLEEGLESSARAVDTFKGGGRARGSGVGDRREKSGVFEGKEGIRKMRKGLANARETGGGEEDIKATVVVRGRGEIEAPSAIHAWPRTCGRVESRRQRQVGRGDEWDGRQSRRGHDGDHGGTTVGGG
jgi:hypothetical protein